VSGARGLEVELSGRGVWGSVSRGEERKAVAAAVAGAEEEGRSGSAMGGEEDLL
jgi:hypothetical protein